MRVSRISVSLISATCLGFVACSDEPAASNPPPSTPMAVPGCMTAGALAAPAMPPELMPPAASQLFLRLRAEGTQIYTCQATMAGGWAYTLKAPEARLINDQCIEVGTHFAGPTWAVTADGSQIVGKKAAEAPSPTAGSIPWLLIMATSTTPGMMAPVSHVQRVDTVGGLAPTEGCDAARVGNEVAVGYTATYLFYRAN
jgi:hypothetical protein